MPGVINGAGTAAGPGGNGGPASRPARGGAARAGTAVIPGVPPIADDVSGDATGQAAPAYTRNNVPPDAARTPAMTSQQSFISQVAPGAMAAQARYGIPAAVTIAQAIDESGWGQSVLAVRDHNLFGIKGGGPAGSDVLPTQEFENGQWVTINAPFRVYHNVAESIADHSELLATGPDYQRAMADRHVPDAFANDLTGVYATDPGYGSHLISIMQLYNLYRYNTADPGASAAQAAAPAPAPASTAPAAAAPQAAATGLAGGTLPTGAGSQGGADVPGGTAAAGGIVTAGGIAAAGGTTAPGGIAAAGGTTAPGGSVTAAGTAAHGGTMAGSGTTAPVGSRGGDGSGARGGWSQPGGSGGHGGAAIPGLFGAVAAAPAMSRRTRRMPRPATPDTETQVTRVPQAGRPAARVAPRGRMASRPNRYVPQIPPAVSTAFLSSAKVPLNRAQPLYADVASRSGIRWELLAACDWMQCKAQPKYSPVYGEKLGKVNAGGTVYRTKSEALAQCASDLVDLAMEVYWIDITARRPLSVRDLARIFAAFRWGGLLKLHNVSAMEFPYSVAGLTPQHVKMRWPDIKEPNAPDKPGARFRLPFGAVPVVLSLGYPAVA